MTMWLAVFVQLDYDRQAEPGERLTLRNADVGSPIFLCGPPVETLAAAEDLARDTIRTATEHRRGSLLPRVFRYEEEETLIECGDRAEQWFQDKVQEMNHAEITIEHSKALF